MPLSRRIPPRTRRISTTLIRAACLSRSKLLWDLGFAAPLDVESVESFSSEGFDLWRTSWEAILHMLLIGIMVFTSWDE